MCQRPALRNVNIRLGCPAWVRVRVALGSNAISAVSGKESAVSPSMTPERSGGTSCALFVKAKA